MPSWEAINCFNIKLAHLTWYRSSRDLGSLLPTLMRTAVSGVSSVMQWNLLHWAAGSRGRIGPSLYFISVLWKLELGNVWKQHCTSVCKNKMCLSQLDCQSKATNCISINIHIPSVYMKWNATVILNPCKTIDSISWPKATTTLCMWMHFISQLNVCTFHWRSVLVQRQVLASDKNMSILLK